MLDSVQQQLVDHQRETRATARRQQERIAGKFPLQSELRRQRRCHEQIEDFRRQIVKVHRLRPLPRQELMKRSDSENAVHALRQRILDRRLAGTACLHPQKARDGLQIIFDAVMDFADGRFLHRKLLFLLPERCHVLHDHDAAQKPPALENRKVAP